METGARQGATVRFMARGELEKKRTPATSPPVGTFDVPETTGIKK
jgi:hypothetical protein